MNGKISVFPIIQEYLTQEKVNWFSNRFYYSNKYIIIFFQDKPAWNQKV